MGWNRTLQLVQDFEKNYIKLHQRIETAKNRGEQLTWKNYKPWYIMLVKKTKSALRPLKKDVAENPNLSGIVKNLESSSRLIFKVDSSTDEKWNAIDVVDKIWIQFKAELDKQIKSEYDMFRKREFKPDSKLCFVLMPFEKSFNPIYREAVKPAARKAGLKIKRADEIFGVKPIVQDIWENINKSAVIIAELTSRNTNVFYEVGLSHALPKPIIFITQTMDDVPFDLKYVRCLRYKDTPKGRRGLSQDLYKTIKNILS